MKTSKPNAAQAIVVLASVVLLFAVPYASINLGILRLFQSTVLTLGIHVNYFFFSYFFLFAVELALCLMGSQSSRKLAGVVGAAFFVIMAVCFTFLIESGNLNWLFKSIQSILRLLPDSIKQYLPSELQVENLETYKSIVLGFYQLDYGYWLMLGLQALYIVFGFIGESGKSRQAYTPKTY